VPQLVWYAQLFAEPDDPLGLRVSQVMDREHRCLADEMCDATYTISAVRTTGCLSVDGSSIETFSELKLGLSSHRSVNESDGLKPLPKFIIRALPDARFAPKAG
jgi:hypothetical protein